MYSTLVSICGTILLFTSSLFAQDGLITIENVNLEKSYQKELLHYKTANEFLKNKEYEKALAEFKKIRMINPLHFKVDESIKECRINLGKWVAPDTETDDVWVEIDPYNLANLPPERRDSVYQVAVQLDKDERFRNAQKIMSQLVELDPTNKVYKTFYTNITDKINTIKQSLFEIGQEFYKRGLYAQALKEWYKTLFYSPDDNLLLSNIQNAEKKLQELRNYYIAQIAVLEADGKENELLVLLNTVFYQFPTDDYFKNKYNAIQQKRDTDLSNRIGEGQNYFLEGNYDKAEEIFSKLLIDFPGNLTIAKWNNSIRQAKIKREKNQKAELLITSIETLISQKKISEAELTIKKLSAYDPTNSHLPILYQKVHSEKKALENDRTFSLIVTRIKESLNENDITTATSLIKQADNLKPGSETIEQFRKIIAGKKSIDVAKIKQQIAQAQTLYAENKFNEAESALPPGKTGVNDLDEEIKNLKRTIRKSLLQNKPTQKINHAFLAGISSYRMGDYKKALTYWLSVIEMEPGHKQALTYIENVKKKIKLMEGT